MQFRELTDRYQLQKIVKSTRFGTVLRATDNRSGQMVAAKLITVGPSPGLAAGAPEFEKLAGVLGNLRHPNLPAVLDSGFTPDGSAFFVLELLEGKSLDTVSGLTPARILKIMGQALSGLEVLAGRGVAHHNLSPDNVFLATAPAGDQVKLLGLGTAIFRPRGPAAGGAVATESARFLAPELLAGTPADWHADLYSLALTTCHALGATVGLGDTPVVQMPLAVSFELESDEALRQVLERCLRQKPAERATPREFREALLQALGNQTPAPQMPDLGTAVPVAASPLPRPAPPPSPVPPPAAAPPPPLIGADLPPPVPMPVIPPPVPFPAATVSTASAAASLAGALPALDLPPLGDEPSPEGDVLQSVDDEVLNALLSVPPPPPRAPKPGAAGAKVVPFLKKKEAAPPPAPTDAGAAPAPATSTPWFLSPLLLGALAGILVLAGVAAVIWYLRRPQPLPPPPPKAVFVANVPTQPPTAQLEEAMLYLAQGDDLKARRTLHSISFGEQGLLPPEGCRQLGALQETLALISLEHLPSDLQSGLKTGDLEVLRNAVEASSGQEAGLTPDVRANFDRARGIVDSYGQALAAAAQGNHVQVLERFAALQSLLPKMSDPEDLRGKAASALEAEAEGLVKDAKYGAAVVQLEPISRTWPDRPGLKDRIAKYQDYQENETRQEALLATLPNIERRRKPSEALSSMAGIEPTPHLAPQFAAARKRLGDQLARLDQAPPQVVLRDGFLLDYSRGTVINLSFRATDDYQVKDVKFLARPQGGKMRELPLEKSRTGYYTVEIAPTFHQNETVDFYVVATDLSGHEASLGSRDKPLQLKRKQGFERLIR
jgi:serine/threonine protein kinase